MDFTNIIKREIKKEFKELMEKYDLHDVSLINKEKIFVLSYKDHFDVLSYHKFMKIFDNFFGRKMYYVYNPKSYGEKELSKQENVLKHLHGINSETSVSDSKPNDVDIDIDPNPHDYSINEIIMSKEDIIEIESDVKKILKENTKSFNIYHLWIESSGYEEYDGFVVVSKDLESAKQFILSEYHDNTLYSWKRKEVKSRLIGTSHLKEEQVILESYIRA